MKKFKTDFEKLKEIKIAFSGDPKIRVNKNGVFQIECVSGKYTIEDWRLTNNFDFEDYKNKEYKGIQGHNYVVWQNSEFDNPFPFYPSDICRMNFLKMTKKEFDEICNDVDSYGSIMSKDYTDKYK